VRAGTRRVQVGAEGWCRSNQRMGRELVGIAPANVELGGAALLALSR